MAFVSSASASSTVRSVSSNRMDFIQATAARSGSVPCSLTGRRLFAPLSRLNSMEAVAVALSAQAHGVNVTSSSLTKYIPQRSYASGTTVADQGTSLPSLRQSRGRRHESLVCMAAAADAEGGEVSTTDISNTSEGFLAKYPALVTGFFFFMWYLLNVIFNIRNKQIYNYFPYPYFVSVVHLGVGVAYCLVSWAVGLPKRAPMSKEIFRLLVPVAFCHALGHVMSNVSFAAVAVSFSHTVKALEPFFNAAASQFVLGQQVPFSLWLSLAPVVIGVSMASMTELSFNWTGFLSAMTSNIAFTYRSVYSKKIMTGMDSTNLYAYISIIALLFCIPPAILIEGPALLQHGLPDAVAKVGQLKFLSDLFWVGMFYHLYNQVATNTLERVAPLTHAVGNVLKRVFVIGFTIIFFGNKISTQTGIGTVIAIAGVAVYSYIKAQMEEAKKRTPPQLADEAKAV